MVERGGPTDYAVEINYPGTLAVTTGVSTWVCPFSTRPPSYRRHALLDVGAPRLRPLSSLTCSKGLA